MKISFNIHPWYFVYKDWISVIFHRLSLFKFCNGNYIVLSERWHFWKNSLRSLGNHTIVPSSLPFWIFKLFLISFSIVWRPSNLSFFKPRNMPHSSPKNPVEYWNYLSFSFYKKTVQNVYQKSATIQPLVSAKRTVVGN